MKIFQLNKLTPRKLCVSVNKSMKKIIFVIGILLCPSVLFAQASFSIPVDDGIYRAIDRFIANGIIENIIVGQRPYSADEIARLLIEAEKNSDQVTNPVHKMTVYRLLEHWKKKYSKEIKIIENKRHGDWQTHPFKDISFSYDYLSSPGRTIYNNGLGTVNKTVRPLTEYRDERHYANGQNYAIETYHSLRGPYFALFAHPRFQFQFVAEPKEPENEAFVQELYGKFGAGNFELEIGRDQIAWGQGEHGGLMFTNNERAMDFVKISNPHPFKLPGFLKYIGNVKGSILLSNLGPGNNFKYTYLSAWKISLQPDPITEIGFTYSFMIGGDGVPAVSSADVLRSFFGFIPRVSKHGVSDQFGGVDFRVRIPPAWNAEIYGEINFQNPDTSHPGKMFKDRAAYSGGIYLPRLGDSDNMAIRLEYKHTSPFIYRSFIWPDGRSLSGDILGDPIGPAGDGTYANYYYDLGVTTRFILRFAYERRGGDFYAALTNSGAQKTAGRPTEERYRANIALNHDFGKHVHSKMSFGYENTQNFGFISGNGRNSFFGGISLTIDTGL